MDPVITAALIGSATKLFAVLTERWDPKMASDSKQKKVTEFAGKNFDKLAKVVTDHSMVLLHAAEYGDNFSIKDFREVLYPGLVWSPAQLEKLDSEFHYRLEFLATVGLLESGFREYRISRLGAAFIAEARSRYAYSKVLKPPEQ